MGQGAVNMLDTGATALGGGLKIGGYLSEGFGAKQQAAYQAAVLNNQAAVEMENEKAILRVGAAQVQERQIQAAQTIGSQRANLAGRGIVVDQDTASVLMSDEQRLVTIDVATIKDNTARQAWAAKIAGINYKTQAKAVKKAGKAAMLAGFTGAAGTLLTTGASVASKWMMQNSENLGT